MEEELLTQNELCERLKITSVTAYRYRKQGMPHLGSGKGVRYKMSEVQEWLKKKEQK